MNHSSENTVNPVISILAGIDQVKNKNLSAEKIKKISDDFIYQLKKIEELLSHSDSLKDNPLFISINREILQSIAVLSKDVATLHRELLKILKLNQIIQKVLMTFYPDSQVKKSSPFMLIRSSGKTIVDGLNQFLMSLHKDSPHISFSNDELNHFVNTSLSDLPHFQEKALFFEEPKIYFQFLLHDYEIIAQKAFKIDKESQTEAEIKKTKKKYHYYDYIVKSIKNTLQLMDDLAAKKCDPKGALEKLYCNTIVNPNLILGKAQQQLHQLVKSCISSPDNDHLPQIKNHYISLNDHVKYCAIQLLCEKLYDILNPPTNIVTSVTSGLGKLFSNTAPSRDDLSKKLSEIIDDNYSGKQDINLTAAVIADKVVTLYLNSEDAVRRPQYFDIFVHLINILTNPLNDISLEIKKRLRFLLTYQEIRENTVLQEQINWAILRPVNENDRFVAAGFSEARIATITAHDEAQKQALQFSIDQIELYELINMLPEKLNELEQHIKKSTDALPSGLKNKYQNQLASPPIKKLLAEVPSPWKLTHETLAREEQNSIIVQFFEVHRNQICPTFQQHYNEFQRVFIELPQLNNLFGKIFKDCGFSVSPKNLLKVMFDFVTVLTSENYRKCIVDLFIYSAGRAKQIQSSYTDNQFIAYPILSSLNRLQTHFTTISDFLIHWCTSMYKLCEQYSINAESILASMDNQFQILLMVYKSVYDEEVNQLKAQVSSNPLKDSLFLDNSQSPKSASPQPLTLGSPLPLPSASLPPLPLTSPPPLPSVSPPPPNDLPPPLPAEIASLSRSNSMTLTTNTSGITASPSVLFKAPANQNDGEKPAANSISQPASPKPPSPQRSQEESNESSATSSPSVTPLKANERQSPKNDSIVVPLPLPTQSPPPSGDMPPPPPPPSAVIPGLPTNTGVNKSPVPKIKRKTLGEELQEKIQNKANENGENQGLKK